MKSLVRACIPMVSACFLTVAAWAAEAVSPVGTWKWSVGRAGQTLEQTLKLDYAAGKLTGTLLGPPGGGTQFPDTPIGEASFQDGVIKFSVTRELNNTKVVTRYEGKLEGDAITGQSERPNPQQGGEPVKRSWRATRATEAAK